MERVGVSTKYFRAALPTTGSSFSSSATTEGTSREPSSPGMTTGVSPCMKATREFVVPKSIPTTGDFFSSLIPNPCSRTSRRPSNAARRTAHHQPPSYRGRVRCRRHHRLSSQSRGRRPSQRRICRRPRSRRALRRNSSFPLRGQHPSTTSSPARNLHAQWLYRRHSPIRSAPSQRCGSRRATRSASEQQQGSCRLRKRSVHVAHQVADIAATIEQRDHLAHRLLFGVAVLRVVPRVPVLPQLEVGFIELLLKTLL